MDSAAPLHPSTKETSNYAQLCHLLVGVGSLVLREIFDRICPPGNLHTVLNDPKNHAKLQTLRKKRVLSTSQWCKLYPTFKSSVSSRNFETSLVVFLLRNIWGLTLPASGQNDLPPVTDTSPVADIARIKILRDRVYSHVTSGSVDDPTFISYWSDIKDIFQRIGGARYQDVINDLKTDYMDADIAKEYQELFREWLKDEDCITDKSHEDEMVKKAKKGGDMEDSFDISELNSWERETVIKPVNNGSAQTGNSSPPELSVYPSKYSDLPGICYPWETVELPVDILLLTVEECEFLSCFAYLKKPFKSYHFSTGIVYFGCMGDDQGKKMKIALMRCSKDPDAPRDSLSVSKDAILLLRPKAIFSVGACSGLNRKKVKLGDVVVSSKLTTVAHKTPPSSSVGNLIKHVADGWKAPLLNACEYNVEVHCNGVVLSISEANRDMIRKHPEAIAVEMEGGGVFEAAHDLEIEWMVVKGIKGFADETQFSSKKWKQTACVMAASFVANILNHPVIFQDWPHLNAGTGESHTPENCNVSPPELSGKLPLLSDLPMIINTWDTVELPVDVLLLTEEECEFLSCFAYLKNPFKSYHISTGLVYFGCMGDDQGKKMKIALMRCSRGHDAPGGSLSASKDAILLLRPKATFSVGTCSGLNSKKVKLGDVVISAKLMTATHRTPPSRDIVNLIKHVADGWKAPLQNAKVHCDGVVLSISEANRHMIRKHPEAIAVEMEGGGLFKVAHDFKTQWMIVKGIKDFADETQSSSEKWEKVASLMAASVVANILNHPVIFQDWPHLNAGTGESHTPAISAYTAVLRSSILGQTEFQHLLLASRAISNAKTDEIFTNLLVQHGRKALIRNDLTYHSRRDVLEYYGKISGTPVKHCSEIFLGMIDNQESANSILVVGKPGIGKSMFCQKVIRDWANSELFQVRENSEIPELKFVYLLSFCQLNLLENDVVTLREILNWSSSLDDECNIDDSTFEYIVKHPKEVMIILDGYDEYSQQDYIAGNLEEQHRNDARLKMPVAALCSKLIRGKILKGAIVMVTSRPDESDKMGRIHFKRYLEIAGFSSKHVKEYIEKYFTKNEVMKTAVLKHVMNNENLVSFAHIPILCFLLCFEMEYTLTESENPCDLPVSATDIYTKLVYMFELKLNVESEYRHKKIPDQFKPPPVIKKTLEKLSKLAAKLLLEGKRTFDESEMEGDFELEEVNKLKGSGLLYCGQPLRTALISTTKHFSFTHVTVQEFLAARWFVRENCVPDRKFSEMVFQFMAGVMPGEGNEKLMEKLLDSPFMESALKMTCLNEYGNKEFAKKYIRNNPQAFCTSDGVMALEDLSDADCIRASFVLDIISELNREEAGEAQHKYSDNWVTVKKLELKSSQLSMYGIQRLCNSLNNEHCPVSELNLSLSNLSG